MFCRPEACAVTRTPSSSQSSRLASLWGGWCRPKNSSSTEGSVPGDGPARIPNLISGEAAPAASDRWFDRASPVDGKLVAHVARSDETDVDRAVRAASAAQAAWASETVVRRGEIIRA